MKWSILIGAASACVIWLIALFMHDWSVVTKVSGTIAVVFILLSGIISRAFVLGNTTNVHYVNETKKDREKRVDLSTKALLLGAPHLVTTLLCVMYVMR
ncbi:MAG: DUF5316 domain-containing protein [Tumebacillaceae bacterium]